MLGWGTIVLDVGSVVVYILLLPLLLVVLYLLAWKEIDDGTGYGINRDVFWLLLLGGTIGWVGNIPIFYWAGSVMALNIGGALIPISISVVLLAKYYRPASTRGTAIVLGCWGAASAASLVLSALGASWVFIVAAYLVAAVLLFLLASRNLSVQGSLGDALSQYALLSVATVGTYLTTYVEISAGIVSEFPLYLLPPLAIALLAVAFRLTRGDSPGLAYATMTLGAVVGADVLHQPPLYAPSVGPILGAIGGAGPLDLVYLSGLLSLSLALILSIGLGGRRILSQPKQRSQPTPMSAAMAAFEERRYSDVAIPVLVAVSSEASKAHRLLSEEPASRTSMNVGQVPGVEANPPAPSPPPTDLEGLPLHSLVKTDYANLKAMAADRSPDRASAWKALCTGLFIMRALKEVGQRKLASSMERARAFLLDMAITMGPATLMLLVVYMRLQSPGPNDAYSSIAYEAAILAAAAYPLVALGITEWLFGTTPGKWLVGIRVAGRDLGRPTLLQVIGRNVTKLITTTPLAIALALSIAFAFQGGIDSQLTAIALAAGGVLSVFVSGGMGLLVMLTNTDRRRVGDLMAGTQVLRIARRKARRLPSPPLPSPFVQA
jgi:uncharacterized RDD family membrane protein YckC/uncharacterized membrane protein